jgi:hypothetical protein
MRLSIVVLVVAVVLIVDQLRFGGYYRWRVFDAADAGAARAVQLFR